MSAHCLRTLILTFVACMALSAANGHACTATAPDVFTVGNKATDAACTFSTIKAAVDAASCAAGTNIILTDEVSYAGELDITNHNVALIGRASGSKCGSLSAVCGQFFPCPTAPLRTITGTLKIRGTSNVTLQYLTITGGNGVADSNNNTHGGGIDYAATGRLDLYVSTVTDNNARDGGGIRFQGYNGHADLYLHSHTLIQSNHANGGSGGGLRLEGDATLHADEPYILFYNNTATDSGGKGGGILVVSPSSAHISSIGDFFFGAPVGIVWANRANYGGGIAVVGSNDYAGESTTGHVTLAASDLHYPVRIEGNSASKAGGGIYLQPFVFANFPVGPDGVNFASLSASGYRIDGNSAVEGSAFYVDTDTATGQADYGGIVTLTPVTCLPLIDCDIIEGNVNQDGANPPNATAGSTVLVQTSGTFEATGVRMTGNYGGAHLIRDVGSSQTLFSNCLLSGNHDPSGDHDISGTLIEVGYAVYVEQCTIAGNAFGGSHVIEGPGFMDLIESVIDQPGKGAYNGSSLYAHDVVATDAAGLPADPTIEQEQPLFFNAADGDYRLLVARRDNGTLLASQGVDFGKVGAAGDKDIDGRPRDRYVIGWNSAVNLRDLGAFEMQPIEDQLFASGFGDAVRVAY